MTNIEQLSALISFLEGHKEMALGRCSRSKEGRSQMKRLWAECADILNSISSDCVSKTADQWRLYYNEYKSKLVKKIKADKAEKSATGGGPAKPLQLTPLQERLYSLLGRDVGDPLPGVRHNPLSQNSQVSEVEAEVEPEVETMELELVPEIETEVVDGVLQFSIAEEQPVAAAECPQEQHNIQQPQPQHSRSRRRRPCSQRADTDSALQEAQNALLTAEAMSSEALRLHALALDRHAAAMERQAAAMEAIAAALSNLSLFSATRRRRIIDSDDSENE